MKDRNRAFHYSSEVYRLMVSDRFFENAFMREMPFAYQCFLSGMAQEELNLEDLKRAYLFAIDYQENLPKVKKKEKKR